MNIERQDMMMRAIAACGLSIRDVDPFVQSFEAAAEGNEVLQHQMAMLCCMFYNVHRSRYSEPLNPQDFMPRPKKLAGKLRSVAMRLGAKIKERRPKYV